MLKIINVKETFANALLELSAQKPLEKITVKEIVNQAGAGRQTFYNHFSDKYDLINWFYDYSLEEIVALFCHCLFCVCVVCCAFSCIVAARNKKHWLVTINSLCI